MKSRKGSVLVMTVGFMMIFTMFGIASMSYSGFQGQGIVMKTSSTQGFWLAEAGVQRAISHLSKNAPGFTLSSQALGSGQYTVTVAPLSLVRWTIDSVGTQQPVSKEIHVEYGPDVKDMKAIQTTGDLTMVPAVFYTSEEDNSNFTPLTVFGRSLSDVIAMATNTYSSDPPSGISGITVVTSNSVQESGGWYGSGILIIKPTNGGAVTFKLNGGSTFDGLIWIEGTLAQGWGNGNVNGAIFVNCGNASTRVTGSASFTYDQTKIDNAIADTVTKFKVVSWQEVN